ncbi:hypothetical protein CEF21_15815 [Bacillus sp. FJAT-42376]|nr:hypothetical protein CEF21_15815 [Bacillus sp. FJAT-42376]
MQNSERKQIIIDEINHWKSSRLLPETYCDFLLALYTGGNGNIGKQKKKFGYLIPCFILLVLPASLFIYFTEMNHSLQIALLSLFTIFLLPVLKKSRKQGAFHYYLGVLFLLLMLMSLLGADFLPFPKAAAYAGVIMLHSAVWVVSSFRFKIRSFLAAGIAGLLFSSASFFF